MNPARDKKKGEELIQLKKRGLDHFHFKMLTDKESAESLIGTISNYIPIVLDYFPQPSHISSDLMYMLKSVMSKLYEFKNIYDDESINENHLSKEFKKLGYNFKDLLEKRKL